MISEGFILFCILLKFIWKNLIFLCIKLIKSDSKDIYTVTEDFYLK